MRWTRTPSRGCTPATVDWLSGVSLPSNTRRYQEGAVNRGQVPTDFPGPDDARLGIKSLLDVSE
jgi:hypothetical protein